MAAVRDLLRIAYEKTRSRAINLCGARMICATVTPACAGRQVEFTVLCGYSSASLLTFIHYLLAFR